MTREREKIISIGYIIVERKEEEDFDVQILSLPQVPARA